MVVPIDKGREQMKTAKLNATAVILTLAFGVFILLIVRHQEAMMKSGGCTTCGGAAPEPDIGKAMLDLFNAPVHADDVSRAFTLASVHGLTVAQIRGAGHYEQCSRLDFTCGCCRSGSHWN